MKINLLDYVADVFDALKEAEPRQDDNFFLDIFISEFVKLVHQDKIESNFTVIKKDKVEELLETVERSIEANEDQEEYMTNIHAELEKLCGKAEVVLDELIIWTMVKQVGAYIANNSCECEYEDFCKIRSVLVTLFQDPKKAKSKIVTRKVVAEA